MIINWTELSDTEKHVKIIVLFPNDLKRINVTIGRVLFSDPIAFVDAVTRRTYF